MQVLVHCQQWNQELSTLMFALEYFNSDVFIWNFCLNVFEAFILLKFFLQVTMNIGKIKSCQSIFTPPPSLTNEILYL